MADSNHLEKLRGVEDDLRSPLRGPDHVLAPVAVLG